MKRGLQITAARFGRHTRKPHDNELILLMYHRILPRGDLRAKSEEPGMLVTPETFRMHMSLLSSLFQPICLSEWLEKKTREEPLPERCFAVTFDDGWADNYEYAFPILRKYQIPATIFLVSDMVGTGSMFWPERLSNTILLIAQNHSDKWEHPDLKWIVDTHSSYAFDTTPPTQEQLSYIIADCKVFNDELIHSRLDIIDKEFNLKHSDNKTSLLSWQQINEMCESGLIEMGSHTCHHIRLTDDKNDDVLRKEIVSSKSTIENNTGREVKTFCFPNGDYSEASLQLVRSNYLGSVTTRHGWNTANTDEYLLNRIGLHEDISNDKTSFMARISGWI